MLVENLNLIMQVRGIRQSDIARAAGISRQAVSLWMRQKGPEGITAKIPNLIRLADNLGVEVQELLRPIPDLTEYQVALLWDRLFPTLPAFILACLGGEARALARMVQVYGLLITAKLFGKKALTTFPDYCKHIHPVRRKESEQVWKILSDPT